MPIVGKYIYGYNSDTLEKVVGEILLENHATIATAESCTGGYLASKITSVPGSSAYFSGSIVSYSNEVKENTLDVPEETLQQFGVVSKETVSAMAQNVRNILNADIGVATSGIAGPSGGTEKKPVGTVWIAVADENGTTAKKFSFAKDRLVNIEASAKVALNMVRQRLNKNAN